MVKNIKVNETNFKNLMANKGQDAEVVDEYLVLKNAETEYNNKKMMGFSVGVGTMVGTLGFTIVEATRGIDCGTTIAVLGGIGVLTTAISLLKGNPYTKVIKEEEEFKTVDKEYKKLERKIQRNNK